MLMNNATLRNKNLYKIFLGMVKFLPMFLAIIQIACIILNYLGISAYVIICLGGSSFTFIGLLFILSYLFRFCYLYRIPLWYILTIGVLNILRSVGLIPIDLEILFRIYLLISGVFVSLFVGYMYKNRNKPKVDHIKQLCENYAECNCK